MHETVHFVIIIIFDNCRDPTQVLAIIKRTGPDLTRKRENNKRKNEARKNTEQVNICATQAHVVTHYHIVRVKNQRTSQPHSH